MRTDIFTVKRRLRDYRREMGQRSTVTVEPGLRGRSGRVVITAIVMYVLHTVLTHRMGNARLRPLNRFFLSFPSLHRNAVNFVFKLFAWFYTGSHSMFAECIHSFADTTNQIILAYGIHKSTQVSVCVCCYLLLLGCHSLIIHQMFVMFMFADGRSRSPVRIYKYEICIVIDIGRWNLLRWHRSLILPWHNGFDGARTVRGFLLGILYTWRFIIVRRCNTHGGCELNTTISKAGKRVISRVCDSWRRSIGKCSII